MAQKARIRLSGIDPVNLDGVCDQVKSIADRTGVSIAGPVPLPTKKMVVPARKAQVVTEPLPGIAGKCVFTNA